MDFKKVEESLPSEQVPSTPQGVGDKVFGQQFDPNQSKFNNDRQAQMLPDEISHHPNKLWLWLTLAIVLIGGGFGGWWYYNNRIQNSIANPITEDNLAEANNQSEDNASADANPIPESPDIPADSDNDGLTDEEEITWGTDPNLADTDGDTFTDSQEIANGYNPLGEGKLEIIGDRLPENNETPTTTPEITEFNLATAQNTADAMAYAINNNDTELLSRVISPNHPTYNDIVNDPASFLALYQYTFEFKKVRIEIAKETPEQYPDTVTVETKIYLDDVFYQDGSSRLEKIGSEWKILQ